MNARFLRSSDAPDTILFRIGPVDGRIPALEDGLSWPELLTQYDITGISFEYTVLSKSPRPRAYTLLPISESSTAHTFGESIAVPHSDAKAIWVQIDARHSLAGAVKDALYRAPRLYVRVQMKDERWMSYRLPLGMARSGFLLSPRIDDHRNFMSFALPDWKASMQSRQVKRIMLVAGDEPNDGIYFDKNISVRFFELDFPRQAADKPIAILGQD